MLKRLLFCLAFSGLALAQAQAPAPTTGTPVYLSPFLMTGDYKPVTQDQLNQVLTTAVKEVAPDVALTVGATPAKTLTDDEVVAAARAKGCRYAMHGSMEFSTQ